MIGRFAQAGVSRARDEPVGRARLDALGLAPLEQRLVLVQARRQAAQVRGQRGPGSEPERAQHPVVVRSCAQGSCGSGESIGSTSAAARRERSTPLGLPNTRARYAAAAMPSKLFKPGLLDGQVAIVSGGGSGLGRASALELAALGARVVVCGRRAEPLEETAARAEGGRFEAVTCDIREEDQVERARGRRARAPRPHRPAREQRRRPVPDARRGHHAEGLPHGDPAERRGHLADDPRGRDAGDDPGRRVPRRQDRQRHAVAASRPARDGALVGGARRGREPHARALDRVGALRHPPDRARRRPLRHRDAA